MGTVWVHRAHRGVSEITQIAERGHPQLLQKGSLQWASIMRQVLCPLVIGRAAELRTIESAIEAARNGRGGCIFVLGDAGVCKSRLVREADRLAQERGLRVLWGRS